MLKNLKISNFRGIETVKITDFEKVNLIVGTNNSGKTTILETIFLLCGPTNPQLSISVNMFREINIINTQTWELNFYNLDSSKEINISGGFTLNEEQRELIIKTKKDTKSIVKGNVILNNIQGTSFSEDTKEINGLNFVYKHKQRHSSQKTYNSYITSSTNGINISSDGIYEEKTIAIFSTPRNIYMDLGNRFNNAQINKTVQNFVKILKKIEPKIEDLSLGINGMIYCDIGLKNLLPINVMGDGILRIFSVILAISSAKDGIILIDEIENGFHYTSLEVLWSAIFEASKEFNVQIFLTTHSLECVKAFSDISEKEKMKDIKLFRVEKNNEVLSVVDYNYEILPTSLDSKWEVR